MKLEINVPDNLSEITLGQYQRFEKLNTKENQDSVFLLQKMIEIFCGLELKDVINIKYKSIQEAASIINEAFEAKHIHKPTFKMNGQEYGFVPVLDDMTLGEYVDLDENLGDWQTIHKAMSVLYRPITYKKGSKYQINKYTGIENADSYKEMPLDVVFGSIVFFYNLSNELTQTILNYLQKEMLKPTIRQKQLLEANGDGINQSMDLLREMLPDLMRLPNLISTNA